MISIIVVTFNSEKYIKPCLGSIYAQDQQDFEVIVVDNGSDDGTVSTIKNNYPGATLIENSENLGACKARNQGINLSSGRWVVTLDCDTVIEKDFLSQISYVIENAPSSVGIIQPKILKEERTKIYSTGIFLSFMRRFYDIGRDKPDSAKYDYPRDIFGACAAAAVYNRSMLDEIREETGYFDERFFFLVEDVDLSWRAQRIGWKALYYPKARCFHAGGSSGVSKKERRKLCFRNRRLLIKKNELKSALIMKAPFYLLYDLPRFVLLINLLNKRIKKGGKDAQGIFYFLGLCFLIAVYN